jgi:hypothetical protein
MTKIKLSILGLLALFLSITAFIACSKDNNDDANNVASKLRTTFLEGKNYSKISNDFNLLSKKGKTALWDDKLNQLLEENLPIEHKELITALKLELNKEVMDAKKISTIAINLAKLTPEEDFAKMFANLNDYNYDGKFEGKTKISLVAIEKFKISNSITSRISCNCEWTCSWYGSSSSNCSGTRSGCGFMWFFECEHAV